MILVELTYKVDLTKLDEYLVAHRAFLDKYYQQGLLLMSGPKEPRTGGIIIALTEDLVKLSAILAEDPFYQNDLADYRFTPFKPIKYHPALAEVMVQQKNLV
jgi:uncharacterized protein YciI